uniref:Hepatoma-derived growth factor-related protein 2 n=1 Tax=Magallana gigas TaxID=29159 RepID=K1RZH4_MAGGI
MILTLILKEILPHHGVKEESPKKKEKSKEDLEKEEKAKQAREEARRAREEERRRKQEREREREPKSEKKKRREKRKKIIQTEGKLSAMDKEIKLCVQRDSTDVDKCLAIMEDLDALPVNQVMLKKNPDIMKTIKMVGSQLRKYKGSEKIRLKAEVIYHKFKGFFLAGDGELNSSPQTLLISDNEES